MALREVLGETLPVVNATLNGLCAMLLVAGRRNIAAGERLKHQRMMLAAFVVSTVFLASYLTRESAQRMSQCDLRAEKNWDFSETC